MDHSSKITITLLGCGTSTGVPLIHCSCKVCRSKNPKNNRQRASAWVQVGKKSFLIDTSPDLRAQAIQNQIPRIDAILFTHPHADHVSGLDEIRSFNFIQKSRIPAYANSWTYHELKKRFPYIFTPAKKQEGGGIPQVDLHLFSSRSPKIQIQGVSVIPLSVQHGSQECIGYRFGPLAYITDCNHIPPRTLKRLHRLQLLIIDCLRVSPPHGTHFHLESALETIRKISPDEAILTHLGHSFDYPTWMKKGKLPPRVRLAYDGLKRSL